MHAGFSGIATSKNDLGYLPDLLPYRISRDSRYAPCLPSVAPSSRGGMSVSVAQVYPLQSLYKTVYWSCIVRIFVLLLAANTPAGRGPTGGIIKHDSDPGRIGRALVPFSVVG